MNVLFKHTRHLVSGVCALLLTLAFAACGTGTPSVDTEARLSLPTASSDKTATAGFFKGVSGAQVGRIGDYLIVAGGSNFPEKAAADGGQKLFYSDIYAAKLGGDTLVWQLIGHLPQPLAYGMAVSYDNKLYIAGGREMQIDTVKPFTYYGMYEDTPEDSITLEHSEVATDRVFSLAYDGKKLTIDTTLMPLPAPLSSAAAVLADSLFVVIGGVESGASTNATLALNLQKPTSDWKYGSDYPGAPLLKVTATAQRTDDTTYIYMVGSFAGHEHEENLATLSLSAFRYNVQTGTWQTFAAPVEAAAQGMTFGGGMAWPVGEDYVAFTGGVNHHIFLNAINRDKVFQKHRLTWERFERYYANFEVPDRPIYPTEQVDSIMAGIDYPGDDATPEEMARYYAKQAEADHLWQKYDKDYAEWRQHYGKAWDKEQDENYVRFDSMQKVQTDSMERVKDAYLRHKPEWYGFCDIVWLYNVRTGQWHPTTHNPDVARADAGVVLLPNGGVLLLGGETMPGIRTPQITRLAW